LNFKKMISQIKQQGEWITLNIVNAIYLVKDWVLLNVGVAVSNTLFDDILKWSIGLTIIVFNIVRIVKYIIDIKQGKNGDN